MNHGPGAEGLPELHDADARGSGEKEGGRGAVQVAAHLPGRQEDSQAGGRGQDTDDPETASLSENWFIVFWRAWAGGELGGGLWVCSRRTRPGYR